MSIYVSAIRKLLYYNRDLFNFLVTSGLYDRYHDALITLQRLKDLLENEQLEDLTARMDKIDKLRAFSIDYIVTYILFKNPDNLELAKKVAEVINYQTSILINYINSAIETAISKSRGEISRVLLVARMLSYFGELLSTFEEILLGDPDNIITYVLYKANYISSLVESRGKVAKKLKELSETIEEASREMEVKKEEGSEELVSTLSSVASDLKYEYLRSLGKGIPVHKRIFNKREIRLISMLLQRNAVYPKGNIALDTLANELNIDTKEVLRLINAIWDKCKDFDLPLIIKTDRIKDTSGKEVTYLYIDPDAFRKAVNKLSKAHPELVELFVKLGYGI